MTNVNIVPGATTKEMIFEKCKSADLKNEAEAIALAQWLANELIARMDALVVLEDTIAETLTAKQYREIIDASAKRMFHNIIDGIEESDLKEFLLEHEDEITKNV